jgi:hypothetical protein
MLSFVEQKAKSNPQGGAMKYQLLLAGLYLPFAAMQATAQAPKTAGTAPEAVGFSARAPFCGMA